MAANPARHYVGRMHKLRISRGGKCEGCGKRLRYSQRGPNLQFAHVRWTGLQGRGRGLINRFLDIVRHPRHYKMVCRACHLAMDMLQPLASPADVVSF